LPLESIRRTVQLLRGKKGNAPEVNRLIDYQKEVPCLLRAGPRCALEIVEELSEEYDTSDLDDVKLHVLLELRQMVDYGNVEIVRMGAHDGYAMKNNRLEDSLRRDLDWE
jgi:hypothetical protein